MIDLGCGMSSDPHNHLGQRQGRFSVLGDMGAKGTGLSPMARDGASHAK